VYLVENKRYFVVLGGVNAMVDLLIKWGYISIRGHFVILMDDLMARLTVEIRRRIAAGDFTERGFSRMTSISQSHMNNVLKGERVLTPILADRFMRILRIDVLDLMPEYTVVPRKPVRSVNSRDQPFSRATSR